MRCFLPGSALSLLIAPIAVAQPAGAPEDEVIDLDAPERREAPRAVTATAAAERPEGERDDSLRPAATTIGIGIGYVLPSDVFEPETASVRLRFASGLTLEPRVDVGTSQASREFLGSESEDSEVFVSVGTDLRMPLVSRGPVDFLVVGGAGLSFTSTDPDGDDNDSSVASFGLSWGIGLDYWISERWALSATASNPLLSYRSTSNEQGGADVDTSSFELSATFDPVVRIMGHLYF